jgi:hypothetical protein
MGSFLLLPACFGLGHAPAARVAMRNYISFFCRCDMVPAYRGEIGMSLAARFLRHARLRLPASVAKIFVAAVGRRRSSLRPVPG